MVVVPETEWAELNSKLDGLCAIADDAGCGSLVLRKQSTLSWLLGADGVAPLVHDPDWPQLVVRDRVRPGILHL